MSVKGKCIKDYILGDSVRSEVDMQLLEAKQQQGKEFTVLMVEKKNIDQQTFIAYNNLLQQNSKHIHPKYIEAIQSTNNIYLVLEKVFKVPAAEVDFLQYLPSMVQLYRNMGQFKLQGNEIFVTAKHQLVYLPFYKRLQTSSKLYAQFHNKSVLGQVFCKLVPLENKNRVLDIFIKNIDNPSAAELISKGIKAEMVEQQKTNDYPGMEDEADDQQILQLMSKVKVNADMKRQAGNQFMRQSSKRNEQSEPEIGNIIQNVQSSMFVIKGVKSSTNRTKIDVKLGKSKFNTSQFDLYFTSYCESLRFLKRSLKQFLSHYKNSFAGIISAYLLSMVITLRKAYLIKELQQGNDIFDLNVNMREMPTAKCMRFLKREMKSEAKMIVQLKDVVEGCNMPVKTYSILAPYLQDDISLIDIGQLQTFTFFFLSALLKAREKEMHQLYMVEVMYILLHRNYEIVFFLSDFPTSWNQQYFDTKVTLIGSLLPSWSLK